jgi:hydrogenase maturation protein HypF
LAAAQEPLEAYPFRLDSTEDLITIRTNETLASVAEDAATGKSVGEISTRFHRAMAEMVAAACRQVREAFGVDAVALSGGVFQNRLLFESTKTLLVDGGFTVYRHHRVPTNDGGLCLGQAVLADRQFRRQ